MEMPIRGPKWSFTSLLIVDAPLTPGAYALWIEDDLMYLGAASVDSTIRAALVRHWKDFNRSNHGWPTHFSWEISYRPAAREAELLLEFRIGNAGREPLWNRGAVQLR